MEITTKLRTLLLVAWLLALSCRGIPTLIDKDKFNAKFTGKENLFVLFSGAPCKKCGDIKNDLDRISKQLQASDSSRSFMFGLSWVTGNREGGILRSPSYLLNLSFFL